jgi:hypothetical protein
VAEFDAAFTHLSHEHPEWGVVATLPWDGEIFGFNVGEYRPGPLEALRSTPSLLRARLASWAVEHDVELIACRTEGDDTRLRVAVSDLGFRFVETSLRVTLPRLRAARLPPCRATVRLAEGADHDALEKIAATSFHHGRYHADPWFPRELADRRYLQWLRGALSDPAAGTHVYVVGPRGSAKGFLHVEVEDAVADLRLGAVDPDTNPGTAGFSLYLGTMHALAEMGVRSVVGRVLATNTAVMNLYAALGFHFSDPEVVQHWHRDQSPDLRPRPAGREQARG